MFLEHILFTFKLHKVTLKCELRRFQKTRGSPWSNAITTSAGSIRHKGGGTLIWKCVSQSLTGELKAQVVETNCQHLPTLQSELKTKEGLKEGLSINVSRYRRSFTLTARTRDQLHSCRRGKKQTKFRKRWNTSSNVMIWQKWRGQDGLVEGPVNRTWVKPIRAQNYNSGKRTKREMWIKDTSHRDKNYKMKSPIYTPA